MQHLTDAELKGLLEDTLPPELQAVFMEHIDECPECRKRISDYTESVASLNEIGLHPDYRDSLAKEIQAVAAGMRATNVEPVAESVTQLSRIRSIGTGGFGEVFEYKDLRFNRSVAVKFLQDRWLNHADAVQRFLREMELTAEIDHPGCPAVYGSGKTDDGRDFYWMQLVTGDSLTDVIHKAHHSSTFSLRRGSSQFRQLLTTFIQICEVIQAAHDKGILHRDLKPSNIRQHANQFPVVLDWGLATRQSYVQDQNQFLSKVGRMSELTFAGDQLGSPAFISPEAAGGKTDKICKRSDIYLLGGILYAMLTGEGPHQFLIESEKDGEKIVQLIQEGYTPSFRGLPPELVSICRKALAVNIEDRYESALALSQDIDQWLAGEPVKAHRYGVVGLVGLAVRRRPGTTAIGFFAAGLLAFLSVLSFGWWQDAKKQRLIAENRFGLGFKAWKNLIDGVQSDLSTVGGTGEVRQQLLEKSVLGLSELLVDAGKQPGAELFRIQAAMELAHLRLREKGEVAAAKADYQSLKLQLENLAYSHDLPVRFKLLGDAIKGVLYCVESEEGKEVTESLLLELKHCGEAFEKRFPSEPAAILAIAQAEVLVGRYRQMQGDSGLAEALTHYKKAEFKLRQLPESILEQTTYAYELLLAQGEQASVYNESGDDKNAVRIQEEVVARMKILCEREPTRRNRIGLISDQLNLGIYLKKVDPELAADKLAETLAMAESLESIYVNDTAVEQLVRQVENNLAGTYRILGRPDEAIRLLKRSVESLNINFDKDDLDRLDDYAISWGALGNAYKSAKQLKTAADAYRECARIRQAIMKRNPRDDVNRDKLLSVATSCAQSAEPGTPAITSFLEELYIGLDDEERKRLKDAGNSGDLAWFSRFLGGHLLAQARATGSLEKAAQAKAVLASSYELFLEAEVLSTDQLRPLKEDLDLIDKLLESPKSPSD